MKNIVTIIFMLVVFQTVDAQDVVNIYSARHYDTDNEGRFDKGHGDQDAIGGNAEINSLGEVIIEEELLDTPKIVYSVKVGSAKLYLPATFVNWYNLRSKISRTSCTALCFKSRRELILLPGIWPSMLLSPGFGTL